MATLIAIFAIVTDGDEYAYWDRRGAWSSTDELSGECLLDEANVASALHDMNRDREVDAPEWYVRQVRVVAAPADAQVERDDLLTRSEAQQDAYARRYG